MTLKELKENAGNVFIDVALYNRSLDCGLQYMGHIENCRITKKNETYCLVAGNKVKWEVVHKGYNQFGNIKLIKNVEKEERT